MRRSLFLVCLLSTLSLAACGAEPGGKSSSGGSDDDDDSIEGGGKGKDGGVSKDGGKGKDAGSTSGGRTDSGTGGGAPPKMLTPTSESFEKDATDRASLPKASLDVLRAGGKSCTAKVLYPYDGTIFPAGLTPPTIMWEGKSDGAYLKLAYEA
ncbi:MAG: hypothetical protein RLZZ450_6512, partial [Pseudomonadota bacterium]